jgi:predicted TIM-barrel fold metal-dependent hydrolase
LFAVANEAGVPVCTHIGSSSRLISTSDDAPPTVSVTLLGINSVMASVDWLMSGVLERFDRLKVILSEGGAGWIPYILERAEKVFNDKRLDANPVIGQPGKSGSRSPRELFAEHMYVCLVDESFALQVLDHIPVDNLLWEGDYPHGDGLWPHNRKYLDEALAHVPDHHAVKIAETNLRRLLGV